MDNEKKIDVFNSLIVINNDRIEGYKTAEAEAKETDLKMLFSDLMETSIQNRKELVAHVKSLGGTPDEGTRVTGKFFRVWMDVKAALTGDDRKLILDSCEYGEDVILKTYKKVLIEEHQNTDSNEQQLLNKQHTLLKTDHDRVKQLRDTIVNDQKLVD
jgi:uncharacterized protein (TIGR02284 family)